MASSRRSFFAQLAGGLLVVARGNLPEPQAQYRYTISRAWKPVRHGPIPILYLPQPQKIEGELQWRYVANGVVYGPDPHPLRFTA